MKNKQRNLQIVLTILGAAVSLIFIFPIYIMIITSLKPSADIFDMRLWPKTFTLSNYVEIFTKYKLLRSIANSLFVAATTTLLSLFLQSTSAYAFSRLKFPGKNRLFLVVLSTMMVPFSVIMIPLFLITRTFHLTNSLWGMIIPIAANGYGVYLLRQFFWGIPKELDESAFIDGATHFQIFYKILLPLCKPILMTLGTSYFIFNWNNYLWPMIVATRKEQWLIQVAIAGFKSERQIMWNLIFAATVVASIPIFLLFSYFQKYIVDGIKTTGMKS